MIEKEPNQVIDDAIEHFEQQKKKFEALAAQMKLKISKAKEIHKTENLEIALFENNEIYIKCKNPEIAKEIIDNLT